MLTSLLKNKNTALVGIDIGSHAVKAVLFEKNGEQIRLLHAIQETIPKGVLNDREIQDMDC